MMLPKILKTAVEILSPTSETPLLDAEILLTHVLQKPSIFLHTNPNYCLNVAQEDAFFVLVNKRTTGFPIAYLTGSQAFWSFNLAVNEATLIPRPDTEHLVELALTKLDKETAYQIIDLGTGSGAVGLAMAKERPNSQIFATDKSEAALEVARYNAKALDIKNMHFYQGNWFEALPSHLYDMIVSNPPYVAVEEMPLLSAGVHFEPSTALFSDESGLKDLRWIIDQASFYLKHGGYVLVEHGFSQGEFVRALFEKARFKGIFTQRDYGGQERVTGGRLEFFHAGSRE